MWKHWVAEINFEEIWPSQFRVNSITGLDNDLAPGWRQAIIWTTAGILLIGLFGTNLS